LGIHMADVNVEYMYAISTPGSMYHPVCLGTETKGFDGSAYLLHWVDLVLPPIRAFFRRLRRQHEVRQVLVE
jgi:hypothetical protein